jgi:hypothetical protein
VSVEKKRVALIRDYKSVFGSEEGKRVLEDIYRICRMRTTTVPQSGKELELFINEGRRQVALHLDAVMSIDLENYAKLSGEVEEGDVF